MSCVACRILRGSFRPQAFSQRPDVDAVCARRRASVSKTPVRLDFDRLLGSCVLKKTGIKHTDGAGRPGGARCGRGSVRKQKSRRPGRWDQRLDSACFKAPFNFRHAPGLQAWRVAEPRAGRGENRETPDATQREMEGRASAHCESIYRASKRLYSFHNLLNVTWNLYATELPAKHAVRVQQEG
jgi:hypothetical protein